MLSIGSTYIFVMFRTHQNLLKEIRITMISELELYRNYKCSGAMVFIERFGNRAFCRSQIDRNFCFLCVFSIGSSECKIPKVNDGHAQALILRGR